MQLKKTISLGGEFAKPNIDFKDGDILTIADEGQIVAGEFGEQYVFKVNTPKGSKVMAFNKTSRNNLIDALGEDSEKWINSKVKVAIVKQMVGDKLKNVVYLMGENWKMNDDGSFDSDNKVSVNQGEAPF